MVSLANQARLLAAQAFNKKVIEQKARERQAKIDRERAEDLAKLRGQQSAKAQAQRVAIEAKAKRESARVFTRVTKGARVGVLTGFDAKRDSKGRAIGISRTESKTRRNTKALLLREIARQREIASKETDLERFLKNERAINAGQVSSSALRRQIAERKARGLSKTPAQKRASQGFRDSELRSALDARAKRKGRPKLRATFGSIVSERARAKDLGSSPFADSAFQFGGRSKKEVIARGGTFGRRVGGESISSQLSFINQARSKSTSGRISFAQGLLSNLNFEGSSQSSLLKVVGNKKLRAPATFQARLRAGVGFFTTEAVPITKPKLSKAGRRSLVAGRKAEDFAKTKEARKTIARQARSTTQPIFNLESFGRQLDTTNRARASSIERENVIREAQNPRFGGFTLSPFDVSVQRQQAPAPTQLSLAEKRQFVGTPAQIRQQKNRALSNAGLTPSQIRQVNQGTAIKDITGKLTPPEKRAIATQKSNETKALRQSGGGGIFGSGGSFGQDDLAGVTGITGLTRATGSPSQTITTPREPRSISVNLEESLSFADSLGAERLEGNIFDVNLSESIAFGDAPTTKKKKGKTTQVSSRGSLSLPRSDFDILDLSSIVSFGSGGLLRQPASNFLGGVSQSIGSGVADFFSLESLNISQGARVGDVSQSSLDREIIKNLGFGF